MPNCLFQQWYLWNFKTVYTRLNKFSMSTLSNIAERLICISNIILSKRKIDYT